MWYVIAQLALLVAQFNVLLGTLCHPQTIPPSGMLCTIICSEMYHEVLSLLQTGHINGMLQLGTAKSEHHTAHACMN